MNKQFLIVPLVWRSRTIRSQAVTVFLLSCWLLASAAPFAAAGQSEDARELLPGAPIERELPAGETHVYKITLAAGNYLRLLINPHDSELHSQLLAPGGSEDVGVYYFPTDQGLRFVSFVAESAGSYRLKIRLAEEAKAGRYEVKIEEQHLATEQDKLRVAAEKAEYEGKVLGMKSVSTGEQRRQGNAKYKEALALWRKLGEDKGELRILYYLGVQYRWLGELETALKYSKEAMQKARAVGDRYREADLMLGFGNIYRSLGENQNALDSFNQARQLFKSLSKRFGEALAVSSIGRALVELGERQNALPYLEEALPTVSSVGDHFAESNILISIGTIHLSLGDQQKGMEFYDRALAVARTNNLTEAEALSLRFLGDANLELGDKQKALDFYEQALKVCRTSGAYPRVEAETVKRIGDVAYLLGDNHKALDFLNQSRHLFESMWERGSEAQALHSLAQVNYSLGNLEEGRKQIEEAIEIQESFRAKTISQQLRETIFTSAQRSFALYIELLMQLHKRNPTAGHDGEALHASERARARSLLDLLSESRAEIREGVPNNLLVLERSLQQQINAKAAARTNLLSDKRTQSQAAFLDKEVAELTARYLEVEVQIRQSSPRYAALTQPQPLTSIGIQQQLDDNTVLLEFSLGEKQSWLWAATRASISSYQLSSSKELESSARKVYELLTARQPKKGEIDAKYQARIDEADAKFQTESTSLSQMLLGQVAEKLQQEWKGKRLAIVAPGALEYIPFAALPSPGVGGQGSGVREQGPAGKGETSARSSNNRPLTTAYRPLIVDHEVINLPSASALAAIRSETAGRKLAEKTVAVLADPVFELTDSRLLNATRKTPGNLVVASARSAGEAQSSAESQALSTPNSNLMRSLRSFDLTNERGGFSRLPFSREEAEAIASLTPKNSLKKATDFQASRTTATNGELSHYRIIHFATHGLLNSERPELSGLVLSLVTEDGKPQDGFLRMQEIYNLNLPADLVVLSACQTALGKQIKGEGLVGLTRGFMYAGAQRVVASLWQVDDLATAQLMKSFYRGMLKEGLRPAAALRAAQLEIIKQKRWSSPFFWAAFTIQGEWK